ncbi:MAG: hypothetical protein JWQ98_2803 [Chlorobi bacterium]|nr:hypothetical protein [Chlorobiota bacterium]
MPFALVILIFLYLSIVRRRISRGAGTPMTVAEAAQTDSLARFVRVGLMVTSFVMILRLLSASKLPSVNGRLQPVKENPAWWNSFMTWIDPFISATGFHWLIVIGFVAVYILTGMAIYRTWRYYSAGRETPAADA